MKLRINGVMLGGEPTGLGVYSINLINYLERKVRLLIVASHYKPMVTDTEVVESPKKISIGGGKVSAVLRFIYMTFFFPKEKSFVYSPTQHGMMFYEKQVITVHDLICLRYPSQHMLQYFYYRWFLPIIIKSSRAVFTVSETTKKDLVDTYKLSPGKVYVIPNGIDVKKYYPADRESMLGETNPYLLSVGASYRHKNIEEVLEQAEYWKERYQLIVVSCGGKQRKKIEKLVASFGLEGKVNIMGYVTNSELLKLYQNCSALVFPSLWEGFGIPPLEAMACGRPVIASDIPVHIEVLGSAPFYIRPGIRESWKYALEEMQDEVLLEEKIRMGLEVAAQYDWESSGNRLLEALLDVNPELELIKNSSQRE